jgi:hypothetical protein
MEANPGQQLQQLIDQQQGIRDIALKLQKEKARSNQKPESDNHISTDRKEKEKSNNTSKNSDGSRKNRAEAYNR